MDEGRLIGANVFPPDNEYSIIPIIQEGETNTTPEELERYLEDIRIINTRPEPTPVPPQIPGSMSFNYNLLTAGSSVNYSNNDNLTIGTQSFTIEWYQYWESGAQYPRVFSIGSYPNAQIALSYEIGNTYLWISNSINNIVYGITPQLDTWSHIAVVGTSGGTIKLYINGYELGQFVSSYSITNTTSTPLTIGNETAAEGSVGAYTGLITNFRWVVGSALYTTNFTPPSIPLTDVSGTQLLLLVSGEDNLVVDSSSANRTATNQSVTYSSLLPPTFPAASPFTTDGLVLYYNFGNTGSYPRSGTIVTDLSPSGFTGTLVNGATFGTANGGVIVFDGTNDYITPTEKKNETNYSYQSYIL